MYKTILFFLEGLEDLLLALFEPHDKKRLVKLTESVLVPKTGCERQDLYKLMWELYISIVFFIELLDHPIYIVLWQKLPVLLCISHPGKLFLNQ